LNQGFAQKFPDKMRMESGFGNLNKTTNMSETFSVIFPQQIFLTKFNPYFITGF